MGSDKQVKPITKFFIYVGIVLGVILLAVIACVAVMFFRPGTSILGYEVVRYSGETEYEFSSSTSLSLDGVTAFEVSTEMADVRVLPNAEEDKVKIIHTKGIAGIAKTIEGELNVTTQIINKSFEGDTTEYKTLIFSLDEPSGLITKNGSSVVIYLPSTSTINTISVNSNAGSIKYSSKSGKSGNNNVISCHNLHLKTGGVGTISIDNEEVISNYYLKTNVGNVQFKTINELSANKIKFETSTGLLEYANKKGDATITLASEFVVKSTATKEVGPQIRINVLNGDFRAESVGGYYRINKIGDSSHYKTVAITSSCARINFDEVYAQVSILGNRKNLSNAVTITTLDCGNKVSYFETGRSNAYIELLTGSASFNSTSGNIKVENASSTSSIWANSTSGTIDVYFSPSATASASKKTTIITGTGNVNVENISGAFNIEVLEESASARLNLSFTAIAKTENVIKSNNRSAVLTLVGVSDELQHRIVSTGVVTIPQLATGAAGSQIQSGEADYLLNTSGYRTFSYNYRIGYSKEDVGSRPYGDFGKTLITNEGSVTVVTNVVPIA